MDKKRHPDCLECGKRTKRTTTKFCSRSCREKYWRDHNIHFGGPPRIKTKERPCIRCKKIYRPLHAKQKYCSKHCMGMARREEFIKNIKPLAYKNGITQQTLDKMSLAASKRNAERTYTKGIGGTRKDIGHYVRSRWEANFARILIFTKQSYQYEHEVFALKSKGKVIRYTPDFKVKNKFYEIKGWWDAKSLLIKELMAKQYPKVKIEYIDQKEYLKLERKFKDKINEWEFK